ncbi:hypothetical protein [Roseinatronobacter sp.]
MSTGLRPLTGVFQTPDGSVYANATLSWFRQPRKTLSQGGAVIIDQPVLLQTDPAGVISGSLYPGLYLVLVRLCDADRHVEVAIPEGDGAFNVADGVGGAAPPLTPELVALARQYRDQALAAQGAAHDSAQAASGSAGAAHDSAQVALQAAGDAGDAVALSASAGASAAAPYAAAAQSSANAASATLLTLGDALLNDLGAFSVDENGDLVVSFAGNTIETIDINAEGDLLMTYEVS